MLSSKADHNIAFVKKIEPKRLLFLGLFIWSILFFTSPLSIRISLNYNAYILVFFSVFSFIIGTLLVKKDSLRIKTPKSYTGLMKLFRLILFISIIGVSLKYADRIFIRGIKIGADVLSNRETMKGGSGNPIGIIASILAPFSFFPLFLLWKYKLIITKISRTLVYLVFVLQVFDSIFLGSRSSLFVVFLFLIFYLLYFKKITFSIKSLAKIIIPIFGFIFFMNYMFVERTKVFAGDNTYDIVLNESNYNYTVTPNSGFKNFFNNQNSTIQNILFTYVTTIQYFTHGIFEFSHLYDNFKSDHALGSYTFSVYARFFSQILGENLDVNQLVNLAPRTGVYTTFYGPLYIDFGWFVILFMLFFGMYSMSIYRKALSGQDVSIILYFYLSIVILFSPVFNFINGAGGIFIFTSFILLWLISKPYYRLKIDNDKSS